ncbi:MAG: CHAT domain-containing protein, partial [Planctomycetota bacterium]
LRDVCRLRYCPTRSLAVLRFEPGRGGGPLGIHAGKMFRGDKPEIAQDVWARFSAAFDRVVKLPLSVAGGPAAQPGGGTTGLAGSLCDTLVILDELSGDGPIAARSLATGTPAKGGLTFGDWLAPPRKRPRLVVLPGLQTALAGGLAKLPAQPGDEEEIVATDLLAAGARTAVVSRWRTGGKSSVDLVEEFIRDVTDAQQEKAADADERPLPNAAESWHRAVDLVTAEQPDPSREPRVKQSSGAVLTDARHPFFWAGYAVVDCGAGRYADPAPAPPAGGKNAAPALQPQQAQPQPPLPQAAP